MLPNALKCLDAYRNIGLIIAQRLRAVNDILKTAGGRFSQSRAKRHFRRMEVLHIRPRRFFENKGFCGFAKQNARVQRAGRPQPEAGAVLPSRMPACSGQADPSRRRARFCEAECPRAAGRRRETVLAAARRQSCPAAQSVFAAQFRMHQAAKPPMAAIRLALGGWLHAVQKP